MTFEEALVTQLQTAVGVTPFYGSGAAARIYPDVLPQQPTYPALVYSVVDETGVDSQQGATDLRATRVQFWCMGTNKLTHCVAPARAVETVLRGFQGEMGGGGGVYVDGVIGEDGSLANDDYDDEQKTYSRSFDLVFWHHG